MSQLDSARAILCFFSLSLLSCRLAGSGLWVFFLCVCRFNCLDRWKASDFRCLCYRDVSPTFFPQCCLQLRRAEETREVEEALETGY